MCFYITFNTPSVTFTKPEAAILKLSTLTLITSCEVVTARYDAILDPSERENLYHNNLLSTGVRNPRVYEQC